MSSFNRQMEASTSSELDRTVFRTILDCTATPVLLLSSEGSIVFLNKALEELTGYSLAELDKASFISSLVADEGQTKEKEILESLVWLQQPETHSCSIRTKGGGQRTQEWGAICFPDSVGRCSLIALMAQQEPRSPHLGEGLVSARNFTDAMLDGLNGGLIMMDRRLRIVAAFGTLREHFRGATGKHCFEAVASTQAVCPNCPALLILQSEKEVHRGKRGSLLERAEGECSKLPAGIGSPHGKLVALPIPDAGGRLAGIAVLVRGDAAEKQLNESLHIAQESLETLIAHLPDGVIIANPATDMILDANGQACNMLRIEKTALVGTKASAVLAQEWQAEYKKLVSKHLLKNRDNFSMRGFTSMPADRRIPIELLAIFVDANGARRLQMILKDVSKERRVEGQLKSQASLLQNVNDAIISVDTNETILFLNKKAETTYGWTADETLCRALYDVVKYEFLEPGHAQEYARALEEKGFWRGEVIHRHRDGRILNIDTSISVVTDDEGRSTGLVMVNRDITYRKEAERKLKRRADEMAALLEIDWAISRHITLKEVLSVIHAQVNRLMIAKNFYIALAEPVKDEVYFPIYLDELVQKESFSRKAGRGYTEYVIHVGQPVLLSKEVEDDMVKQGYAGVGPQALSWLGVPLSSRGKAIGMMAVQSYTQANLYGEDDVRILSAIADQAAIAIDNARMFERIRVSEERYRTLVENLPEGYLVIQSGKIVFANRAFVEFSSYSKDELIGRDFAEFLSEESRAVLHSLCQRDPSTLGEKEIVHLAMNSGDGRTLDFEFNFSSLSYDGSPALVGVCPRAGVVAPM
ncbi:MAG: PAS domain S-box protein [Candidatus Eisenbacteria bacterium]